MEPRLFYRKRGAKTTLFPWLPPFPARSGHSTDRLSIDQREIVDDNDSSRAGYSELVMARWRSPSRLLSKVRIW